MNPSCGIAAGQIPTYHKAPAVLNVTFYLTLGAWLKQRITWAIESRADSSRLPGSEISNQNCPVFIDAQLYSGTSQSSLPCQGSD